MSNGVHYECQRCTACCRWPGFVRVGDREITRLAACLGQSERDFIERHTELDLQRRGLVLRNHPDGRCIFLDGNDCAVNSVKPDQCVGFPNRWNFPGWREICRAIPTTTQEAHGTPAV